MVAEFFIITTLDLMEQISAAFESGNALLFDDHQKQWLSFTSPLEIITAYSIDEVLPALRHVEKEVLHHNCAAAGWVSYEASPAFDEALAVNVDTSGFPLLLFYLYQPPFLFQSLPQYQGSPLHFDWLPTVGYEEYVSAVQLIKKYIASGDTYQVNYTYRRHAQFSSKELYRLYPLINQQPPFFGGVISNEQWVICSGSPELFFTRHNGTLISRPMKGTAPRGLSFREDQKLATGLQNSVKNRAENVMIVDMVRNDLGRIAEPASVHVPELFTLEQYPTLHQMTSTVQARSVEPISEIFRALFPPASITGAPKKRTMEIIRELETTPRRIYTGTMGFILPDNRAQFNVAIRTLLFNRQNEEIEYGVGSGIVWDSDPEEEFEECKTKTFICKPPPNPFSLLETIRWTPEEGYAYLNEHLKRIRNSAAYFRFPLDMETVRNHLATLEAGLPPCLHKVRLLLDSSGRVSLEHSPMDPFGKDYCATLTLSRSPVEDTCFLYHKTTNRDQYVQALAERQGVDDVLLFNRKGELTESTIANIIMVIDGIRYTPPVNCGLLPGTAREYLLHKGNIREKVLPIGLLDEGFPLFLVNSVRGIYKAKYIRST